MAEEFLIPEVLPPAGALVPVLVRPNPLSMAVKALDVPVGTTLAEIVELTIPQAWLRPYAAVAVEGTLVLPAYLPRVRPKAGVRVTLTCVPRNSGGSSGKNTGALIAMIEVIVIASILTYGVINPAVTAGTLTAFQGGLLSVGVAVGASAASMSSNALLPPREPR